MRVLVVNAGSSTLKLSMIAGDERVALEEIPVERSRFDADVLRRIVAGLGPADVVGHRIVHGGARYCHAVLIDEGVVRELSHLTALAPLHQANSLAALAAVGEVLGDTPAVACFDTAFHATMPAAAYTYAVPLDWRERYGVRRYGFHGLAHTAAVRRVGELMGEPLLGLRLVTCHLGAGASLAAVRDGESVDTTMGFTPLDGLVMATRSGSIDPGLVLWILQQTDISEEALSNTLAHDSGLLALAGSADMRVVLEGMQAGDPRSALGLAVYVHHLRAGIAAMAASLGGLDALAFSGGVGEHAPAVRFAAADGLAFLGVDLDRRRNFDNEGDGEISAPHSRVRTFVVAASEDLEIARQTRECLELRRGCE